MNIMRITVVVAWIMGFSCSHSSAQFDPLHVITSFHPYFPPPACAAPTLPPRIEPPIMTNELNLSPADSKVYHSGSKSTNQQVVDSLSTTNAALLAEIDGSLASHPELGETPEMFLPYEEKMGATNLQQQVDFRTQFLKFIQNSSKRIKTP